MSAPLTLHHLASGGVQKSPGITLDLSESGIGAIVQSSLHVGDTVKIDLRLPGCTLRAVAVVRHTSSVRSGFEFVGLTAEERQQITAACGHS